jgi:hypothetical protein
MYDTSIPASSSAPIHAMGSTVIEQSAQLDGGDAVEQARRSTGTAKIDLVVTIPPLLLAALDVCAALERFISSSLMVARPLECPRFNAPSAHFTSSPGNVNLHIVAGFGVSAAGRSAIR